MSCLWASLVPVQFQSETTKTWTRNPSFEDLFRNRATSKLDAVRRFGRFLMVSMAEATLGIRGTGITTVSKSSLHQLTFASYLLQLGLSFFYIHFSLSFHYRA
jgi:hypothetical protein